jgi:hypothetical protein
MRMPGYASGQVLGWALLLSAAGCASPRFGAGGASPSPVVGAWRVQSIEQVLKDGTRRVDWMGPRPAGLVIFDPSGAFSLQYGRDPAADWPAGKSVYGATAEERAALFRAFYGYFGRYTLDEQAGVVHLDIERSLWPTEEGKTMERSCRVEGRQLTLTTPPYPNGSWFILTFERVGR